MMTPHQPSGRIRLSHKRTQQLTSGHLWVYDTEVETVAGDPAAGAVVDLYTDTSRFCGRGLYNPRSKIRVRILTFKDEPIDAGFWAARLEQALALRKRVVSDTSAYRLIHGESDLLPGLIADRYGDVLVLQTLSLGMDSRKRELADLLMQQTGATAVYLRNDGHSRTQEGLPIEKGFLIGDGPTTVEIAEGRATFLVDIAQGQKTGWFCDQRENRLAAASLTEGAEVLEVFCHTGAFGIQAAMRGARSVVGLDVSGSAVTRSRDHAALNRVERLCAYREADAFKELRRLEREGVRYDAIILDPPAFARHRQAVAHALAGYKDINLLALKLLRPQGYLVTCSCSHHVGEPAFWRTILDAAQDAARPIRLLEARSQARDHPVLAGMPETRYLKCFLLQAF